MKKVVLAFTFIVLFIVAGCKKKEEQNFTTINVGAMLSITILCLVECFV